MEKDRKKIMVQLECELELKGDDFIIYFPDLKDCEVEVRLRNKPFKNNPVKIKSRRKK